MPNELWNGILGLKGARIMLSKVERDFKDAGGIRALAQDLVSVSSGVEPDMIAGGCDEPRIDVRIQYHDGTFTLRTGDASYDQDHRGCWGCSSVGEELSLDDAKGIAMDLLDQVLDDVAVSYHCDKGD